MVKIATTPGFARSAKAAISRLKLRHLSCLLEILEQKSLQKAARRLNVTDSAASKTLRELEELLGARLFERSKHGMRPTPEGIAFGRHAYNALHAIESGVAATRHAGHVRPPALRIAAMPIASAVYLPGILKEFLRRYPASFIEVDVGPRAKVIEDLRRGVVDVVLGRLPPPEDMAGLNFEKLVQDQFIFAVRRNHPLARRKKVAARHLTAQTLVIPSKETVVWDEMRRFFTASGLHPEGAVIEILDMEFCRKFVQQTDAVWAASLRLLEPDLARGTLAKLALDSSMLKAPIGIISRPQIPNSEALRYFVDLVRTVITAATTVEQSIK